MNLNKEDNCAGYIREVRFKSRALLAEQAVFTANPRQSMLSGLAFNVVVYLRLVELTGRVIRDEKRASMPKDKPPIIQRLGISTEHWID